MTTNAEIVRLERRLAAHESAVRRLLPLVPAVEAAKIDKDLTTALDAANQRFDQEIAAQEQEND